MTAFTRTRQAGSVRLGAAVGVSLAAALLAACSSAASSSSPAASSGGSAAGLVITTKTSSAGDFLTSGSGKTIYLWMKDGKDSSACSGGCASAWPPVTTTGAVSAVSVGSGVNKADLSTFTRSKCSKQVAYDGHALYYFVGDSGPGAVTGQGSDAFGAKWWLVNPAGAAITTAVTVPSGATPSAPAPGGGGY